jgi:xylulokinase
MQHVLGIDIGTSSVKAGVFDRQGRRNSFASAPSRLIRQQPGWIEHDPRDAWLSTVKALRSLRKASGVGLAEVAAIGLSGHFSTVFLDETGAPSAPCLTWLDGRARAEAEWLATHIGPARMARYLGIRLPLSAAMPPARVLWVSRNCPAGLARTAWTGQTKDYVGWRLHGRRVSDAHSLMGLVRVPDGRMFQTYLSALGLPSGTLPEVAQPWAVAGTVTERAARATGLAPGTPVMTGWIDAYCSMLGTGMGDPSTAFDIAGTAEAVGLVTSAQARRRDHRGQLVIPLHAGLTAVYGLTNAGADSLAWARESLAPGASYATLLREAAMVQTEPEGPLFLPYLEGERSPLWDEKASGALLNLRRHHRRAHLIRAVLEGVAFSVRHNLSCASQVSGTEVKGVRVSGGGTLGAVWNQIKADVLGLRVHLVDEPETGALGAAMLAAIGLNWYSSLRKAVAGMVRVSQTWRPRAGSRDAYDDLYRRYLAAYPALKGALHG